GLRNPFLPHVVLAAEVVHVMAYEQRNILGALAQRGHIDRDDGEPEVEVFAETTFLDFFLEILVRSSDDANVDLGGPRGAEALDLSFLEHAQDLGLRLSAHVADLVEKNGAAVGLFELAHLLLGGACEGSFLMAEQLALDQLLWYGRAVHLDEPLAA